MSIVIISDESGFPQFLMKSVCMIFGDINAFDILRVTLVEHLGNTHTHDVKWSKMRAKKKYLNSILKILDIVSERKNTIARTGIWVGYGTDCLQLYKNGCKSIEKKHPNNRIFHPDKNLTLQRHTKKHIFINDHRFNEVVPYTVNQEPLILIADIFAGIYRESQGSLMWQNDPEKISYIPDRYKAIVCQQAFSLGLFSQ